MPARLEVRPGARPARRGTSAPSSPAGRRGRTGPRWRRWPAACASGSPSCRCAPIRVICRAYRGHRRRTACCGVAYPKPPCAMPRPMPDERGHEAGHDEDPLLPGGRYQLGHQPDGECAMPRMVAAQMVADDETEGEGSDAGDEGEGGGRVQRRDGAGRRCSESAASARPVRSVGADGLGHRYPHARHVASRACLLPVCAGQRQKEQATPDAPGLAGPRQGLANPDRPGADRATVASCW